MASNSDIYTRVAHCTVINLPDLPAINLTRNSEKVNETR